MHQWSGLPALPPSLNPASHPSACMNATHLNAIQPTAPAWKPNWSTKRCAACARSSVLRGWLRMTGRRSGVKRALLMGHSSCRAGQGGARRARAEKWHCETLAGQAKSAGEGVRSERGGCRWVTHSARQGGAERSKGRAEQSKGKAEQSRADEARCGSVRAGGQRQPSHPAGGQGSPPHCSAER
jgi:hypothetical protein